MVGAGLCGLSTALLLGADGHDVVVLERDPAPPPATAEAAWQAWERRGVNQFRFLHMFGSRWCQIVDRELPEVAAALEGAGGLRTNPLIGVPEQMSGGWRDGDERYELLTGRRPVVEAALAGVAARAARVEVRRGVAVAGLRTGVPTSDGIPHVTGVRTTSGEDVDGDLLVDAAGRRSPLPAWLAAIGARPPVEEVEASGIVYYGRYFCSADRSIPPFLGSAIQHYDSVTTVTLPADNGTWGVGMGISGADGDLRRLGDPDTWMRVARSYPMIAHWLDGEPIDQGPDVMAKLEDRRRRLVVDGRPVATGVVAVGDSWACTNPSLGRGASMGLVHAETLRDHLRAGPTDDPLASALAWDQATDRAVGGWYRDTRTFDRHRLAEMAAQIEGRRYRPADPAWSNIRSLERAAPLDPDVLRAYVRVITVQETTEEVLAQPGIGAAVAEKGAGWEDDVAPGPSRPELLAIVKG